MDPTQQPTTNSFVPRRSFLRGAVLAGTATGLVGIKSAVASGWLRAKPVVVLSPSSPLIAQYISTNGSDSTFNHHIDRFVWDWGDGASPSNGTFGYHYYAKPGLYKVKLTVFEGAASSSAAQLISVPSLPPVPSTSELLNNLETQLSNIEPTETTRGLLTSARNEITRAEGLSRASARREALARFAAAGQMVVAINNLLAAWLAAGNISFEQHAFLVFEGLVPVLMSLSRAMKNLTLHTGVAGRRAHELHIERELTVCSAECFTEFNMIVEAIGKIASESGIIECTRLSEIPIIGPALQARCEGEGLSVIKAFEVAKVHLHECLEDCEPEGPREP
jgi:hypothetical protein